MDETQADPDGHIPVLLNEVLAFLDLDRDRPGVSVLDCTLGRGGHAEHILPRIGPGGYYLATDLDAGNLAYAEARLRPLAERHGVSLHLAHCSFAAAESVLRDAGLEKVDAVLADLGFASNQVDAPERGLSFKHDGPLDMRLDTNGPTTAADLVNRLGETELADTLFRLGDERFSRRIARKIVQVRSDQPIKTTVQLAEICRRAYGPKGAGRIDPATRTFQALRIAVNGELDALGVLLKRLPKLVATHGVAGIISFHSLEDRMVKRAFLEAEQRGTFERITRKPVTATAEEEHRNPRSRSAKLRVAKRIENEQDPFDKNPAEPAPTRRGKR
jgi:16S rRNA (cytosine1402-N4)-methyltransferase